MHTQSMQRQPALATVFREETLATALLQRRTLIALGVVTLWLLGLAIWSIFAAVREGHGSPDMSQAVPVFLGLTMPLALLGALWPTSVWQNLGPSQRSYLWAMPVERPQHTLVRVVIGWMLLMLVAAGIMLALVILMAVARTQFPGLALSTAFWYGGFLAATLAYVLVTPLAIVTDHPARWLIGGFFGLLIVRATLQAPTLQSAGQALDGVIASLVHATSVGTAGTVAGPWGLHYAAWLALAVVLTAAALLHHQER